MLHVDWSTFFRHLDRSMGVYFDDIRELKIEDDGEMIDAEYQLKEEFDLLKNRDVKSDLRLLVKLIKLDVIDKVEQATSAEAKEIDLGANAYQVGSSSEVGTKDLSPAPLAAPQEEKTFNDGTNEKKDVLSKDLQACHINSKEEKIEESFVVPQAARSYLQGTLESLWSPKLPTFMANNWAEWSTLLQELLTPQPLALHILLGNVKEGHSQYSQSIDEDLYYLMHWNFTSQWRTKAREVKREFGPKGSILYSKVKEEIIGEMKKNNKKTFERGENTKSSTSLACYYRRLRDCFSLCEENDMPYSEKEKLDIFVMGLSDTKDRHKVMDLIKADDKGELTFKGVFEMLNKAERKARESEIIPEVKKKGGDMK